MWGASPIIWRTPKDETSHCWVSASWALPGVRLFIHIAHVILTLAPLGWNGACTGWYYGVWSSGGIHTEGESHLLEERTFLQLELSIDDTRFIETSELARTCLCRQMLQGWSCSEAGPGSARRLLPDPRVPLKLGRSKPEERAWVLCRLPLLEP